MASISLHHLNKIFNRHIHAVSDLTLDVADGELMVIVGPSGCGKTTTLRLIAGLENPTSGRVHIGGRVVNALSPQHRDVAMVFQDGALYPHLSVYDNLAFPLRMQRREAPYIRRRVDDVAGMLDIRALLTRKPATLSGGQRQRVALGRAIIREPAVFLFDEPFSNLDAELRRAMRAQLRGLHQRLGTTMLYVTHDQSEAMALGQRICVLRGGRMQQVGRPQEVYHRPANRFVAGFVGAPPMNFSPAIVCYRPDTVLARLASSDIDLPLSPHAFTQRCDGEQVILGVRPHDLSLEPRPGAREVPLSGRVDMVEPLGSRTDVHVVFGSEHGWVLSAPPHLDARVGAEVRVYVNLEALHLFESSGEGRNLLLPARPGN